MQRMPAPCCIGEPLVGPSGVRFAAHSQGFSEQRVGLPRRSGACGGIGGREDAPVAANDVLQGAEQSLHRHTDE